MRDNFIIVELSDQDIDDTECGLMNAFKYMVENVETGARWFGSNSRAECEAYLDNM